MKIQFIMIAVFMVSADSSAQAQVSAQTQITQTRDFVSSLLNQSGTTEGDRFSGSQDYAREGAALQKRIEQKLSTFRDAISSLTSGSFGLALNQYNRLLRDTSISADEKNLRLKASFRSLQMQAKAVTSAYRQGLTGLYTLEPAWYPTEAKDWYQFLDSGPSGIKYTFADGSQLKVKDIQGVYPDFSVRNDQMKNLAIRIQITKTLDSVCQTKVCQTQLLSDYSYYFSSVLSLLDRDLTITLSDGQEIKIERPAESNDVLNVLSSYSFDEGHYRSLPERN